MDNKYLTIQEAADMLDVHWQTIRNYLKQGKLPYFKLGRTYRIQLKDIQKISQLPLKKDSPEIEVEKRFLIEDKDKIEEKLRGLGANLAGHNHIIDHWFVPKSIESINTCQKFYESKKGFGLRIREVEDFYSKRKTITLEVKKLVDRSDHSNCLESEIFIQDYQETKNLLNLMNFKEILIIDKVRVIYMLGEIKYIFEDIKDIGYGVEIEIKTSKSIKKAQAEIFKSAKKLGLKLEDMQEKSITYLALDKLAKWV